MSILISADTRVAVQGITGHQGSFHVRSMLAYGTKVVAGVTPGKGGLKVDGIPVYDSLGDIPEPVDASVIFVPAPHAARAVNEALDLGVQLIVVITEGVPVHDSMRFIAAAREKGSLIVGPNTPGLITAGESKIGIMPGQIFRKGRVGILSRSGTLTYEIVSRLSQAGIGQSSAVGLGGDPVVGIDFEQMLALFAKDVQTEAVVIIGEIGGSAEERMARYIRESGFSKPVAAYIAGRSAPAGRRMGHAGAIISGNAGTYEAKASALREAGAVIAQAPGEIVDIIRRLI